MRLRSCKRAALSDICISIVGSGINGKSSPRLRLAAVAAAEPLLGVKFIQDAAQLCQLNFIKWSITTLKAANDAQPPPTNAKRSMPNTRQRPRPNLRNFPCQWKPKGVMNLVDQPCAPKARL